MSKKNHKVPKTTTAQWQERTGQNPQRARIEKVLDEDGKPTGAMKWVNITSADVVNQPNVRPSSAKRKQVARARKRRKNLRAPEPVPELTLTTVKQPDPAV